jgi:hypothetical protein
MPSLIDFDPSILQCSGQNFGSLAENTTLGSNTLRLEIFFMDEDSVDTPENRIDDGSLRFDRNFIIRQTMKKTGSTQRVAIPSFLSMSFQAQSANDSRNQSPMTIDQINGQFIESRKSEMKFTASEFEFVG